MVMPTLIGEEAVGSELYNAGPITVACQGSNGNISAESIYCDIVNVP